VRSGAVRCWGAYLDCLNVEAAQREKVLIRRSSDSSHTVMVQHGVRGRM
jgi:hypothetical protein